MNARNFLYIRKFNPGSAKKRADNKLATKKLLLEHNIATPGILHVFENRKSAKSFVWKTLPSTGFVVKPSRGFGGEGILVFKEWNGTHGTTVSGKPYTIKQLQSHIFDIFEGVYSLQALPDTAYIEEVITPHPFFKKLAPVGLTDIRVIVFNSIPIMAMMRLPTLESGGKANLHQGAIGIGIGLRTGISIHGIHKSKPIQFIPGTKIKTRGIKIPLWDEILHVAVSTQAISGLGYAGVDIVLDATHGPMVLETNARPGLSIQDASLASLRSRLERVEDIPVSSVQRGIEIATSLFAETELDKVQVGAQILTVTEPVTISHKEKSKTYMAKLDTGAYRTSIDVTILKELDLPIRDHKIFIKSASGKSYRPAVDIQFVLAGKKITTTATVADRSHLKFPLIVGRRDLRGFHINPIIENEDEEEETDAYLL